MEYRQIDSNHGGGTRRRVQSPSSTQRHIIGECYTRTPTIWKLHGRKIYLPVCDIHSLPISLHSLATSGTTAEVHVTFEKNRHDKGEVIYEIQHPDAKKESLKFEIQPYRSWRPHHSVHAVVHLLDTLAQRIIPAADEIDLQLRKNGVVSFILSGDFESNFTSSNTPVGFLSDNLHKWEHRTLRQISLPSTHNSGMGTVSDILNLASPASSQCQSLRVIDQLRMGARYLDIRPKLISLGRKTSVIHHHEDWPMTGHYSHVDVTNLELADKYEWFGSTGENIHEIILGVNAFTAEHNELVILHISHTLDRNYKPFNQEDWDNLLSKLEDLNHRYIAPKGVTDLSTLTLGDFIGGSEPRPAVIILLEGFGGDGFQIRFNFDAGFYPDSALPMTGSYSDTNDINRLREDQFSKLHASKPTDLFELHWYLTQQWQDAFRATILERLRDGTHRLLPARWENSLLEFGDRSNQALWKELWTELHQPGAGFPNLITVDNLKDSRLRDLAVAITDRFGAETR